MSLMGAFLGLRGWEKEVRYLEGRDADERTTGETEAW